MQKIWLVDNPKSNCLFTALLLLYGPLHTIAPENGIAVKSDIHFEELFKKTKMMILEFLLNKVLGLIILIGIFVLIFSVLKKADKKYGTTKEEQEKREKELYDADVEYKANELKRLYDSYQRKNKNTEDDGLPF